MYEEYDNVLEGKTDLNKKIAKIGDLDASEDFILSINTGSTVGKVSFCLV